MRRVVSALATMLVAACSTEQQPVAYPTAPPPMYPTAAEAPPAPTLTGTIGGRAFVARSALMVRANTQMRMCSSALTGTGGCSTERDGFDISVSSIRLYERVVTCADLGDEYHRKEARVHGGEHFVELELQGRWPVYPGSTWRVDATGPRSPTDDHVQNVTFRAGGSGSGSLAYGDVRFLETAPDRGVLTLEVRAANPNGALPGSIGGTIPFAVCR